METRMRPGQASALGFLTPRQSLMSLVEEDSARLARLGVTHERVANRLSLLTDLSLLDLRDRSEWKLILGRFWIHRLHWAGSQFCAFSEGRPWCGSCSSEYEILNAATGESFWTTGLHPHLIGEHRFFEGGPYRLEPEVAVRVLELPPDSQDLVQTIVTTQSEWALGTCCCEWQGYLWEADDVRELMRDGRKFELAPGLVAYVSGNYGFLCAPEPVRHDGLLDLDGSSLSPGAVSGGREIFRGVAVNERWDGEHIARLTEALRVPSECSRIRSPSQPPWRRERR
ncbi:MAG TPA: hypothetical protein VF530_14660 [Planctomycetota bacterium]